MGNRSIAISLQQHSYRAAQAFLNAGTLDCYYTTVYNDEKFIYNLMKRCLPQSLAVRVMNRRLDGLDSYVKKYCEFRGLLFLAAGRIPILRHRTLQIRASMNRDFGRSVAKDCKKRNTKLLLMYDTVAYDCFFELDKRNIPTIRILDMASTCVVTIKKIIGEEISIGYSFADSMVEKAKKYTDESVKMYVDEINLADYYLSPSGFVTQSLLDIGISKDKIKYLPHGVDANQFSYAPSSVDANRTLCFLFVGRIEAAKGIYYLLEAFKNEKVKKCNVELIFVGSMETDMINFEAYNDCKIRLCGLKRRDEMPEVYANADVFILSSLWEGSSLSMLEAMASGLPVIASKYSCAPEVVDEFEEGFVVEPRNIDEMVKKILWFDSHRELIPQMSEKARKKIVENYTWEHYYNNLNKICDEILQVED